MNASYNAYLEMLQKAVPEPPVDPDLDDIDEKADAVMQEEMALSTGAIRKGILEQGHGSERPQDGDMVLFHLSIKKQDGKVLQTSRSEEGGSGVPQAFLLGRGQRLPRGWELALQDMQRGERAAFKIAPELSLGQKGCSIKPPAGVSAEADLIIDLQLVNWLSKAKVKPVGSEGVILHTLRGSESWEHPRPPFEISASIRAWVPSSSGQLGSGIPFYASRAPLQWTMGSGRVSQYLEEGISSMAKSEKAILSCPIGSETLQDPLIPSPAEKVHRLEFEVELHSMVQVRDMTGTGEVVKRRIREGVGEFPIDCPLEDNAVEVHFTAFDPDTKEVFYNSRGADGGSAPLKFDTGVDAVPEAVDMCIRLMTPTEVASVIAAPKFAYQGRSDRPQACPEDRSIGFEIELVSFEKTPHWHSMSAGDKIERAEQVRKQGNVAFKLGQLAMARQKYLKALKILDSAFDAETDEELLKASTAKASTLVNLGTVSQKEGNINECFSWCDKALRENPDHPKALYRKGCAHAMIGNYTEAEENFVQAKAADPSSSAEIDREIGRLREKEKLADLKEKREWANFFGREKAQK